MKWDEEKPFHVNSNREHWRIMLTNKALPTKTRCFLSNYYMQLYTTLNTIISESSL